MSESTEPVKVIGVRFRQAGKVYYFDPLDMNIKKNDGVIVETVRGIEFGNVVLGVCEVPGNKVVQPLRPVIRIATEEDTEKEFTNREKEIEALMTCREKVASHDLQMKLVGAEYTFDNSQLLFYFTADGRVDFRDLVKDLAATFKTRIELRQIGPRDETKIIGGIGMCGRPLCCNTYLSDFTNVTIKMAKDQGIALNPQKISGVCNRLMCCLKYEQEVYEELNAKLPNKGDKVQTNDGFVGVVESTNAIRQLVKVVVVTDDSKGDEPTKEIRDYAVSDLKFEPRKKKKPQNQKQENSTEEKSLKSLED
ncbi:MAG: stage 0 sporulation family protein [Lachnospiraceae bacterium]|nr:stage 0 sporulation family protein [Lachnospiraceae bacterium]